MPRTPRWTDKCQELGPWSLRWTFIKDGAGSSYGDCGYVDNVRWTAATRTPSADLANALDTNLDVVTLSSGYLAWQRVTDNYYSGGDSARSGLYTENEQISQMEVWVDGPGSGSFYWKVSSEPYDDYLEFYIDGVRQDRISGEVNWTQKTYTITGSGTHSLLWQYAKGYYDPELEEWDDGGWVDYLQWTPSGPSVPAWDTVEYTYDPSGRRIAKTFDGVLTNQYVYDGDNIIAEYDGSDNLVRKYIQGAWIDQPVSMIDVQHSSATYYYHYDALGNVVALSNNSGAKVETYEYSAFGEVAASDANNPNPFMFTGREYDKETGLYFYRARYYAPEIGRFLQTDPIGCDGGMNLYWYCMNNPWDLTDPYGEAVVPPPDEPNEDRCKAEREATLYAIYMYNKVLMQEQIALANMNAAGYALDAASSAIAAAVFAASGLIAAARVACKPPVKGVPGAVACLVAFAAAEAAGLYVLEKIHKAEEAQAKLEAAELQWKLAKKNTAEAWSAFYKAESKLERCEGGSGVPKAPWGSYSDSTNSTGTATASAGTLTQSSGFCLYSPTAMKYYCVGSDDL